MHFLLILIVLALIFPVLARVVGSLVRGFFWVILALVALAAVGALVQQ
jgi:hypothetical protein